MSFEAARIFSDNMVLQCMKPLNVFGTGTDGTGLVVSISGEEAAQTSVTVRNGRWLAVLPPQPVQDNVTLSITDGESTVTFHNAAVGEVWLAGGQSNMEFELRSCTTGKHSLVHDNPDVRFYYTQKKSIADETFFESEKQMGWCMFSDKNSAQCWSAVGYYFAKELSETLGCPVGIIGCNWGGTSASAWMKREYADGETSIYFDEYRAAVAGKTLEQLKREYREYQEYHAAWEKKSAEYYSTVPNPTWDGCLEYCGENKYPGPPSPLNPMSPGVLHESMVERVAPYTMAGVIWYQGESDDHRPEMYRTLLSQLIRNWRDDWFDDELFFVIGQLPMHRWSADEDKKNWCVIRQAQASVCSATQNTELAVLTDCGEFNEIHPKNKQLPGHRFALAALRGCYDTDYSDLTGEPTLSPEAVGVFWNSDSVDIFINSGGEPEVRGSNGITGFELAGADGEFVSARAELVDKSKWNASDGEAVIHVSGVSDPIAVRYLWTNYTEDIPLYDSENGVPLPPFRFIKPEYRGK
ncbi:MAG: sialate O-acetylesterase [Oscillospiraceae bacterium]